MKSNHLLEAQSFLLRHIDINTASSRHSSFLKTSKFPHFPFHHNPASVHPSFYCKSLLARRNNPSNESSKPQHPSEMSDRILRSASVPASNRSESSISTSTADETCVREYQSTTPNGCQANTMRRIATTKTRYSSLFIACWQRLLE